MASRRDSRVHVSVRQNDALLEFENFKRKYLLVNKHITKLNSTLSVRVEELNAQISSLYVENLRLRASELSLASQLKREKECSQRVVAETQSAVGTLMKHLTDMRTSLDGQSMESGPSSLPTKRKPPSGPVHPPRETVRLVKPPTETITQIRESDEDDMDYDDDDDTPTRAIATRRPSTSRLPLPLPKPTPLPTAPPPRPSTIPHINLAPGATKRKPGRRNSALLNVEYVHGVERVPSPVARSMKRGRRSSLEEEREVELEVQVGETLDVVSTGGRDEGLTQPGLLEVRKPEEKLRKADRKGKSREPLREWEREPEPHSTSERESSEGAKERDKRRIGIKDVTNSPGKNLSEFMDEKPGDEPVSTVSTPLSMRAPILETVTPRPSASPPSAASTPATDGGSEGGEGIGGRERRNRRSVNYAEPKLNTKMRKPDPPPETVSKPRASAGVAVPRRRKSIPTPNPIFPSDEEGDADVEGSGSGIRWTEGRRKTVYNAAVNASGLPSVGCDATVHDDPYGMWAVDSRRHSMAV